jgi:hypothetical protein
MVDGKREKLDVPLPATLVYGTAITCGVLAAIALQIQLGEAGYDLVGFWQNLSSLGAVQLRAAGPWWAIVGVAFIVGGVTAGALSRLPLPWRRFRLLRWLAGTVLVFVLADIGHHASELAPKGAAATVIATLGALVIAAIMALGGAYLTVRR